MTRVPSSRISAALYEIVANDAGFACGYCRAPQQALPYRLEIEHLLPTSLGGRDLQENLWLSCHKCNKLRSNYVVALDPLTREEVPLFNPRRDEWERHFALQQLGCHIVGRTSCGRATVATLRLNDAYHVSARTLWIMAGIFPPSE